MNQPFSLIVTDTSPLFTVALARALEALLRPGLPVRIPDAVYIEATRVHGAPGAEQIVEWINAHLDLVQIVPTDIGIDQQRRLEEGGLFGGLGNWRRSRRSNDFCAAMRRPRPCCCSRTATSRSAAPLSTNALA